MLKYVLKKIDNSMDDGEIIKVEIKKKRYTDSPVSSFKTIVYTRNMNSDFMFYEKILTENSVKESFTADNNVRFKTIDIIKNLQERCGISSDDIDYQTEFVNIYYADGSVYIFDYITLNNIVESKDDSIALSYYEDRAEHLKNEKSKNLKAFGCATKNVVVAVSKCKKSKIEKAVGDLIRVNQKVILETIESKKVQKKISELSK